MTVGNRGVKWRCVSDPGGVGEWLNPADCKSARFAYTGSNPVPSTTYTNHAIEAAPVSGYSIVVMRQPSKLLSSVRFRVPAPTFLSFETIPLPAGARLLHLLGEECLHYEPDDKEAAKHHPKSIAAPKWNLRTAFGKHLLELLLV